MVRISTQVTEEKIGLVAFYKVPENLMARELSNNSKQVPHQPFSGVPVRMTNCTVQLFSAFKTREVCVIKMLEWIRSRW
ncbi:MAG: hypothetical protein PHS07_04215 [Patescibacteria group bacterium]|nr:hypothetical protein [Patescibacteria group bacterium]